VFATLSALLVAIVCVGAAQLVPTSPAIPVAVVDLPGSMDVASQQDAVLQSFLSPVFEELRTDKVPYSERLFRLPAKGKIETLHHDVPFAVNVPIPVQFQDGVVRISWRVTVQWDDPPDAWLDSKQYPSMPLLPSYYGLYRLDEKPLGEA